MLEISRVSEEPEGKESPKKLLSEAVLLAIVPALGFALVYIYEIAYCAEFSVPSQFVRPDLISVLGISSILLVFTAFLVPFVDSFAKSIASLSDWRGFFSNSKKLRWVVAIVAKYWQTALIIVLLGFALELSWSLVAALFLMYVAMDVTRATNEKRSSTQALKHFENTDSFGSSTTPFALLERRLGRAAGILLALTVLGVLTAAKWGRLAARNTSEFWIPASHPNAVLVRNYGDKFICVELDAVTKKPTKKVIIITSTDEKSTQFTATNLGTILQSEQRATPASPTNAPAQPLPGTNSALAVPGGGSNASGMTQGQDPAAWQLVLTAGKDIVTGLAAATAAGVALWGVFAWKRQMTGKTDYELARRLLRATYQVREGIAEFRHPLVTDKELETALQEAGVGKDAQGTQKGEQAVYQARWNRLVTHMTAIDAELLEAEVSWGEEAKNAIRPLVECSNDLKKAARNRIRWFGRQKSIPPEELQKNDDVLNWAGDDSDYEKKLKQALTRVEDFLKPHLGRSVVKK